MSMNYSTVASISFECFFLSSSSSSSSSSFYSYSFYSSFLVVARGDESRPGTFHSSIELQSIVVFVITHRGILAGSLWDPFWRLGYLGLKPLGIKGQVLYSLGSFEKFSRDILGSFQGSVRDLGYFLDWFLGFWLSLSAKFGILWDL